MAAKKFLIKLGSLALVTSKTRVLTPLASRRACSEALEPAGRVSDRQLASVFAASKPLKSSFWEARAGSPYCEKVLQA